MEILVNGKSRRVDSGISVQDLIAALHLDPGRLAVERNREIMKRSDWIGTLVEADDHYEIVQFVGGG